MNVICDCTGKCTCGAVDDRGVLRDGYSIRRSSMIMDAGPGRIDIRDTNTGRRTLAMMSDAEIKSMRDGVKTMTVSEAAKLPIYDNVRGTITSGQASERHFALMDGARPDPVNDSLIDRAAHQEVYERRIGSAWKGAA